jgi:hypothetical protein
MFPQLDDSRWNKYTGESKCGPRTIIVDTDWILIYLITFFTLLGYNSGE